MIKTHPVKNPTPDKLANTVKETIERKTKRIQDYPIPARIATVKALHDLQFSLNKISSLLGMGKDTVASYIDAAIDDQWVQYTTAIKRIMTEKNDVLRYKAANVIENKLKDESKLKLYELTGLYKVLNDIDRGVTQHSNPTLVQTINVHPSLTRQTVIDNTDL
jgi:hypothetical protein